MGNKNLSAYCRHAFRRLTISSDGYASLCCFQDRRFLGSVLEDGVAAIWERDVSQDIRAHILRGEFNPTCLDFNCPFTRKRRKAPSSLDA